MNTLLVTGKLFPAIAGDRICSQGFLYSLRSKPNVTIACNDLEEGFFESVLSEEMDIKKLFFLSKRPNKILSASLSILLGSIKQEVSWEFLRTISSAIRASNPEVIIIDHLRVAVATRICMLFTQTRSKIYYVAHNAELDNLIESNRFRKKNRRIITNLLNWGLKNIEMRVLKQSNIVFTLTGRDSKFLASISNQDLKKFKTIRLEYPYDRLHHSSEKKMKYQLMLVGSMDWYPNIQGAIDFIDTVWPSIKEKIPKCKLFIIGKNPPASILERASSDIEITGLVECIDEYLVNADALIVPNKLGSGIKVKIYEMWSKGIPVYGYDKSFEGYAKLSQYSCNSNTELSSKIIQFYSKAPIKKNLPSLYSNDVHSISVFV